MKALGLLIFSLGVALLCFAGLCGNSEAQTSTVGAGPVAAASTAADTGAAGTQTGNVASDDQQGDTSNSPSSHTLIAYFSRSGNTEEVAREIQQQTGGVLFQIRAAEPYSSSYDATVERYRQERDGGIHPAIAEDVENFNSYEVIFIGYPIWGSDMPPVVQTFLERHDWSGKFVIPFCTHGGSRFGRSLDTLKGLCPGATVTEGYEKRGGLQERDKSAIGMWLANLGMKREL